MGVFLIVVGLIVMLLLNFWVGFIVLLIGVALVFIPGVPYGYSSYRGRRGPP